MVLSPIQVHAYQRSGIRKRKNDSDLEPLFDLGQLISTPGASQALKEAEQHPATPTPA